uniref:Peroxisomal 2,4-dienoyl-CoA reductase [(3E)-enoyl-CoA-producing] n=2 Tax=Anas platyrhynchos TaxID=8839 RepID=U3IIU6_ANAPP
MPENKLQSSETSVLRERSLLSAQGLLSQGLDPRWECLAAGALNFLENSPTRPCRHSGRCWVLCGALAESYPVLHVLGCWGEASPWQEGLRAAAGRQSCPFCLGGRAPSACWSAFALLPPDVLDLKVAFVRTLLGSDLCTCPAEILLGTRCASKKLVAATGQQCLPLAVDVRQPQTIVAAVDEALREFKRIDILVNGAAGNFLCPASSLSFNAFKTVMDIDTLGTFNTSKVLFEKYFRDHGGVIINITATLGYRGQALQVHAGTAKAAIDAMTRHLAVEWGPNNIRVNSLAPGPITGTEGFRRLGGKFAEESRRFDTIPLHRAGNKTEIAHSALYLASPLSSYVTGTTLVVDGGSWLTSANDFPALLGIASSSAKL